MKTSVTMTRKMGGFKVHQRTKDGMFNATSLLNQWIKHSGKRKDVNDFLSNKETKAFIEVLEEKSDGKLFLQKIKYTL